MNIRPARLIRSLYFFLLVACFHNNLLTTNHYPGFDNIMRGMVIGRLVMAEQEGVFHDGGFALRDLLFPRGNDTIVGSTYMERLYLEDIPLGTYGVYRSHHNAQGMFFGMLDAVSPFSDTTNLQLFSLIAAIISAALFTWLLGWFQREFGLVASAVYALLTLFAGSLMATGAHLFWMIGIYFLPFIWLGNWLEREPRSGKSYPLVLFFAVPSLLFFTKSLFTGYELVTTNLVMSTIPLFYYAWKRRYPWGLFLRRFSTLSAGLLAGMILSMALLTVQISFSPDDGTPRGVAYLKHKFLYRTGGDPETVRMPEHVKDAYDASYGEVILPKFSNPILHAPAALFPNRRIPPRLPVVVVMGVAVLFSLLAFLPRFNRWKPLTYTYWLSFLAPLSWFFIFYSHAYIHNYICNIAWYMPTALLAFLIFGGVVEEVFAFAKKGRGSAQSV